VDDYLIWDEFFHEFIVLPERLLREPNFELAAWYAARLGSQLGIPRSGKPKPIHRIRIDDLLALGSEMYLTELGAHEPDTRVVPLHCRKRGGRAFDYLIVESLQGDVKPVHIISDSLLLNPKLGLLGYIQKSNLRTLLD
jgi:hypothetical protein